MAYNGRFNKAKENIKKIIDKMLGDNNNKNRIAILSFNGSVKERAPFSSNAEELKSKLDTIRPVYYWGDGAYTQMAFKNARDMLTKENNGNNKQIVILSYGKSTYANKVRDVEKLKTESVDKVNTTRRILGIPLRYQKKKDGIIFVGDFLTLNIFNTKKLTEDDFDYSRHIGNGDDEHQYYDYHRKPNSLIDGFAKERVRGFLPGLGKISDYISRLITDHYFYRYYDMGFNAIAEANIARTKRIDVHAISLKSATGKPVASPEEGMDYEKYLKEMAGGKNYYEDLPENIKDRLDGGVGDIAFEDSEKNSFEIIEGSKSTGYIGEVKIVTTRKLFTSNKGVEWRLGNAKLEDSKTYTMKYRIKIKDDKLKNNSSKKEIKISEIPFEGKLRYTLKGEKKEEDFKIQKIDYSKIMEEKKLEDKKPEDKDKGLSDLEKPKDEKLDPNKNGESNKDVDPNKDGESMPPNNKEDGGELGNGNDGLTPKKEGDENRDGSEQKDNLEPKKPDDNSNSSSDNKSENVNPGMDSGKKEENKEEPNKKPGANKDSEIKKELGSNKESEKNKKNKENKDKKDENIQPKNLVERISGRSRFETAVELSKKTYEKADYVVISNAYKFPDVLASTSYANSLRGPILFTDKDVLPSVTMGEINRLGAKKVIISGGTGSVSSAVESELKSGGIEVTRLGGSNRYQTSKLVAQEMMKMNPATSDFVVADGMDYPDALAISSLASKKNIPILLSDKSGSNEHIKTVLSNMRVDNLYIAGGTASVPMSIEDGLRSDLNIGNIIRYAGANRYETASIIARNVMPESKDVVLTSGEVFADALAAGSYAYKKNAPIVLVRGDMVPEYVMNYLINSNVRNISVVGGDRTLSQSLVNILEKLVAKKSTM